MIAVEVIPVKWQVQEAKQKFSEVLRRSIAEGPQFVTRHGREVAVVISVDEYRSLTGVPQDFKEFLMSAPDLSALKIERSSDRARPVKLG